MDHARAEFLGPLKMSDLPELPGSTSPARVWISKGPLDFFIKILFTPKKDKNKIESNTVQNWKFPMPVGISHCKCSFPPLFFFNIKA